jgi:DNA-binding transcriptional regulator PaaX
MLGSQAMPERWRLLIYTVPSEPTRKRAYIWRELKKAGAVYLRDGVCALPEREDTAAIMQRIAAKIEEFEGEPTVIAAAELDERRTRTIMETSRKDRQQEYTEVIREADNLLKHIERETLHREFTFAELEELEADLEKLRGWFQQVQSRDYFGSVEGADASALLERCAEALGSFAEAASEQESGR